MLFSKQHFGSRIDHLIAHGNIALVDKTKNGFIENKYTISVFSDLLEAFDIVKQKVLIEKLKMYFV